MSVAWYLSWVDHLGGVRVALGAPRPRQQARKVRVALGAPPSPLDINSEINLGAPRFRQQAPTRRTTTGYVKYASESGPQPRRRRAAQPTSGGPDRLHNVANSLGVAGALRRASSQQNLEFSHVQRRRIQRQSIHIKSNALHGIQPWPGTTPLASLNIEVCVL